MKPDLKRHLNRNRFDTPGPNGFQAVGGFDAGYISWKDLPAKYGGHMMYPALVFVPLAWLVAERLADGSD